MSKKNTSDRQLMAMFGKIAKLTSDEGIKARAMQMRERMQMPMDRVLKKVPGKTVTERIAVLKVSRQTYYYWLRGVSRPNHYMAQKLAELTGFEAEDIRGRTRLSPVSNSPAPPRLTRSPRAPRRVKRNRNNLPVATGA